MENFWAMVNLLIGCGSLLIVTFLVLLSLPKSKLRSVLMPIVGWALAIFCAAYCISPVDILPEAILGPFGFFDDLGAAALGIASAMAAHTASKEAEHST